MRDEVLETMSLDLGFWREGKIRVVMGGHRRQGCFNVGADDYNFMLVNLHMKRGYLMTKRPDVGGERGLSTGGRSGTFPF